MSSLDTHLQQFRGAMRSGNSALDKIMEAAGALDPMHYRTAWKTIAAQASDAGDLLRRARQARLVHESITNESMAGGLRLLVCGSRDWTDREMIRAELKRIRPVVVIEGECRGADTMARDEAHMLGIEVLRFPADWDGEGRSAGMKRNQKMLHEGHPDLVLAFHDDINKPHCGTRNMLEIAEKARVPTRLMNSKGEVIAYGGRVSMQQVLVPDSSGLHGVFGYVDVETTGWSPARDQIIELAIVAVEYNPTTLEIGEVVDRYGEFQDPGRHIPDEATAVNHITDDMVAGKSLDLERIQDIIATTDFLAAHSAQFDSGFLVALLGSKLKPWLCTRYGIKWKRHGLQNSQLQEILEAHNINPGSAHRAMDDVLAALELLRHDGCKYFQELVKPWLSQRAASGVSPALAWPSPAPRDVQ